MEKMDRSVNPVLKADDVLIVPRLPKAERIRYINVIGAVAKPGVYSVEEPLSLAEALSLAGGPSSVAVLSRVSILGKSDGEYSWTDVDFESFLSGTSPQANPEIQLGQTVFVPAEPKEKIPFNVALVGQVRKPGSYPVTDEYRIVDAIYQAGGFTDEADISKVVLIRSQPGGVERELVNVKEYFVSGDEKQNPLLEKGDTIFVPITRITKIVPGIHTAFVPAIRVSIIGAVYRPETYQVSKNASVLDLLKIAGGHTSEGDLEKVTVIREKSGATGKEQRQKVDLKKVLKEGRFELLPELKDGDTIFVPIKTESMWRTFVKLAADISIIAVAYLTITGQRYR